VDLPTLHSYWTIVVFVVFVGIVVWAWSGKRKQAFDEAARIPLDEDQPASTRPSQENHHG
jgi:cytochrome c oxidase cbb3-type subunit 4